MPVRIRKGLLGFEERFYSLRYRFSGFEERNWRGANYGHAIARGRARILVRVSANISYR